MLAHIQWHLSCSYIEYGLLILLHYWKVSFLLLLLQSPKFRYEAAYQKASIVAIDLALFEGLVLVPS